MKKLFVATSIALCMAAGVSQADTFYLKNGKKVIGKKVKVEGDFAFIKERASDGFVTTHKIKISDITKETIEDLEADRFKEVQALGVSPDLQTVEWYKEQHEKVIKPFFKDFENSPKVVDVKKIEIALLAEMKIIAEGGLKVGGSIILPAERQASAYDIDSRIQAEKFHKAVKKGRYSEAIEVAEKMSVDFPRSKAYGNVVTELPLVGQRFKRVLVSLEKRRVLGLKKLDEVKTDLGEEDYALRLKSRQKASGRFEAIIEKEKEAGKKWFTINPYSQESIAQQLALIEVFNLGVDAKVETYVDLDLGATYTKAWKFVEKHEFDEARKLIDKLEAQKMNDAYLLGLDEFCTFERDKLDEVNFAKLRGNKVDVYSQYMGLDERIQSTLIEATTMMRNVGSESKARSARSKLKMYAARMKRLVSSRDGLEKLPKNDMDSHNGDFAIALGPILASYRKASETLSTSSSAIRNYVTEPMNELSAATPNPDELMTDEIKKSLAKMKKNILDLQNAVKGVKVVMPKNYQGNAELYYKIGKAEHVHKIEKPASGLWEPLLIRSSEQKIQVKMNDTILDAITPEGILVVLDKVGPFADKDGNKSVTIGWIRNQEGDYPLAIRLIK